MYKTVSELKSRLPEEHQDMAVLTQHIYDALDKLIDRHQRYVGVNATAGVSQNGVVERTFVETINYVKQVILNELEKTTQDIEHQGDKNWDKNYKEGID